MKLIQRYGTLLLAFLMMLHILTMPLIYIDFKLNQDFIAKVLCINRDKPITTCNGHCFLNKQLKEQQEKQQAPENQVAKKHIYETFCQPLFEFAGATLSEKTPHLTLYQSSFIATHLFAVFHPPQV